MTHVGFSVVLPISDRRLSYDFYTRGLGLAPDGEIAGDGLPEPLQFDLGNGVQIMLVPPGGLDWALGDRRPATGTQAGGPIGALLSLAVDGPEQLTELFDSAIAAGGSPIAMPQTQPWQMVTATVADPDGHLWLITSPPTPAAS